MARSNERYVVDPLSYTKHLGDGARGEFARSALVNSFELLITSSITQIASQRKDVAGYGMEGTSYAQFARGLLCVAHALTVSVPQAELHLLSSS